MSSNRYSSLAGVNNNCRGVQQSTSMPYSVVSLNLCSFLFKRGWISSYSIIGTVPHTARKTLCISFKYHANENAISRVCIKSTPGRRIYWTYGKLFSMCRRHRKNSYYVISTSRGLLSSHEALSMKIGGELLAQILF